MSTLSFRRDDLSVWQRGCSAVLRTLRQLGGKRRSQRDIFLAEATDLADLERRMRQWERNSAYRIFS